MSLERIRERAEEVLGEIHDLDGPIRDLDGGQWSRELQLSEDTQREVRDLGAVELRGNLSAALHVDHLGSPPTDLDAIAPDPDGGSFLTLSNFFVEDVIRQVRRLPSRVNEWRQLRGLAIRGNRRLPDGALRMMWAHMLNLRAFEQAHVKTRRHLAAGTRLKDARESLVGLAAKTATGSGAISTRPLDAKYLVFVLAEGQREAEIDMTFRRGSVDVTI